MMARVLWLDVTKQLEAATIVAESQPLSSRIPCTNVRPLNLKLFLGVRIASSRSIMHAMRLLYIIYYYYVTHSI